MNLICLPLRVFFPLIALAGMLMMVASCATMYDESMAAMVVKGAINNDLRTVMRNVTPANVRMTDARQGEEAIYFAARHGNKQMINILYNNGASLRYRTHQGRSLAYVAAAHGHNEVAHQLVRRGGGTSADVSAAIAHRKQQIEYDREMTKATLAVIESIVRGMASSGGGDEVKECIRCGSRNVDSSGICAACSSIIPQGW